MRSLVTLGMGAAAGLVNGVIIAFLGVPAVVMTLAMNGIMEGLTLGLSGGMTCGSCASYAPPVVQAAVHGSVLGIPAALILWVVVIAAVSLLLSFTTFGRKTYAIGNNVKASYLAGVNVRLVTVLLYMLSGLFAALAGILLVGFGGQASLGMGDPYLFQSIAAVVIGGVYMLGGRGHYLGTAAGRRHAGRAGQRASGDEHARLRAQHHLRDRHPHPPPSLRPRAEGGVSGPSVGACGQKVFRPLTGSLTP